MTDILVSEGYAAAGYEYINVDDCWPERERDPRGRLVPDRERFPFGMKSLSDYLPHSWRQQHKHNMRKLSRTLRQQQRGTRGRGGGAIAARGAH
ncbi:hypothetical protein MSG28_014392 [Choristoneura fumiferana]|uniref:Uncharacterized protein n=1 Tax=Choristoneura fumiferana TaxID=7141 RepID=A0ACC0JRH8_CHOFU|nr:hypothetical protein MSG28_014392 [Choristoneura fumiferana]